MKWRFLNVAVFLANLCILLGPIVLYYIEATPGSEDISRYEFIDLSLAILNLMVAILAIILAVAAFWGYSAIREAATHKAAEVADHVAREIAQRYAEDDEEARTVEQFAAFIRQRREQNKNKSKPGRPRKPVSRPASADRDGDDI
jgi:hypothetical protein